MLEYTAAWATVIGSIWLVFAEADKHIKDEIRTSNRPLDNQTTPYRRFSVVA